MNSHFLVKNINGTSQALYANSSSRDGSSWLEVWRREARSSRATCCALNCSGPAEVGAHVILCDGRRDGLWYLVPFCKSCNHNSNVSEMFIDSRVTIVPLRPEYR